MQKEIIINSTIEAVTEVVKTMSDESVVSGSAFEREKNANMGEITVMVGFSGEHIKGVIALHINRETALVMASKIFDVESDDVDDEVLDCCGEFGNMVAGCIKKLSVNNGVKEYALTVPTITFGLNFFTRIQNGNRSVVFPFSISGLDSGLNVEVKVDEE